MNYFIIFTLIWFVYTVIKYKRVIHMFQQNLYNDGNRYLKWVFNNYKKIFSEIDIFFIIPILISLIFDNYIALIIGSILYIIFSFNHYKGLVNEQTKKP